MNALNPPPVKIPDSELERIFGIISEFYTAHLKACGVKRVNLKRRGGGYTLDALVLIYLAQDYPATRRVHKSELTKFVRLYYPDTTDVQQARHLGAQKGWWILAGGRDNIVRELAHGYYQLHTLEKPYPNFKSQRRDESGDFGKLKAHYHYRCAVCGSQEGQPHLRWPGTKTKLQAGHMDPAKDLTPANTIPQCQNCNRADKDTWVYDNKGRPIAAAGWLAVRGSSKEVKQRILAYLCQDLGVEVK